MKRVNPTLMRVSSNNERAAESLSESNLLAHMGSIERTKSMMVFCCSCDIRAIWSGVRLRTCSIIFYAPLINSIEIAWGYNDSTPLFRDRALEPPASQMQQAAHWWGSLLE